MGGKPSKQTPADKRLKENKPRIVTRNMPKKQGVPTSPGAVKK